MNVQPPPPPGDADLDMESEPAPSSSPINEAFGFAPHQDQADAKNASASSSENASGFGALTQAWMVEDFGAHLSDSPPSWWQRHRRMLQIGLAAATAIAISVFLSIK